VPLLEPSKISSTAVAVSVNTAVEGTYLSIVYDMALGTPLAVK
jgi:hypothetical protein